MISPRKGLNHSEERVSRKMEREIDVSQRATSQSAAEGRFEHANDGVLLGDDLGLPYQGDGHNAHGENAERENQAHLGFRGGDMEDATHPGHR